MIDSLLHFFKRLLCSSFMILCRVFPINKRKVVFSSYFNTKYSDSPKYIFEKMKEIAPDLEYIWLIYDTSIVVNGAKVIKSNSLPALYHLATAKCWIDNCRKRLWVKKRKDQYYVQTWHGGIALKNVERSVQNELSPLYVKAAKHDSKMADLFISGSRDQTDLYKSDFWYKGRILESGLPRCDVFFNNSNLFKEQLCQYLNCSLDTHFILYAPTFRANNVTSCYDIDYIRLISAAEMEFGGKWIVLIRLHPIIADKEDVISETDYLRNVSSFQESSELIMASDIVITDYSSCMFDAMEANKTVYIYASDIENYQLDRGFRFPLFDLPFPIATNNDELIDIIANYDTSYFEKKRETFKKTLKIFDNADSSSIVARFILHSIDLD